MSIPGRLSVLRFSPTKRISKVPLLQVQRSLIAIFKQWGVPQWIKVDNGRPFGDPLLKTPPPLALWLIGMGIAVSWNRPATPQDNAVVERSQGVMARWTEYQKSTTADELKARLHKEAHFHNYHFPIRRQGGRKRCDIYPSLSTTGKEWNEADFDLNRVLEFLAEGYWERKVSVNGQVSIYGHIFSIGRCFKHQKVSIKLDAQQNAWQIFDAKGSLIKTQPTNFSEESVCKLDLS